MAFTIKSVFAAYSECMAIYSFTGMLMGRLQPRMYHRQPLDILRHIHIFPLLYIAIAAQ